MDTNLFIRRHINSLTDGKPFSIRDCLRYGPRNVVDQIFHRLVQSGQIVRVARGVYVRNGAPIPAVDEVAMVKAKAFYRKIIVLNTPLQPTKIHSFLCNSSSSSFRYGKDRIYFMNTCARKMSLGQDAFGIAVHTLWQLGRVSCTEEDINAQLKKFNRTDRQQLKDAASILPGWLHDKFRLIRYSKN